MFGVDGHALPVSIARMAERHVLESERLTLQRDLHEIADGRDEETLRQEREGLDLDLLPGAIAREEARQSQLLRDIAEASAIHHDKKNQLEALLKGRNAPAFATERTEAGAELLSVAQRWLLRATASRLASRTIERHRAMVQDPLIARASILFTMATDEAFAGLVIAYGDDDQPVLVARRRDGEKVPALSGKSPLPRSSGSSSSRSDRCCKPQKSLSRHGALPGRLTRPSPKVKSATLSLSSNRFGTSCFQPNRRG